MRTLPLLLLLATSCVHRPHIATFHPDGTIASITSLGGHTFSTEENSFSYIRTPSGHEIYHASSSSDSSVLARLQLQKHLISKGIEAASSSTTEIVNTLAE